MTNTPWPPTHGHTPKRGHPDVPNNHLPYTHRNTDPGSKGNLIVMVALGVLLGLLGVAGWGLWQFVH